MTWLRVDDRFFSHAKVVGRSHSAIVLYLAMACWSSEHLHDGAVPRGAAEMLARALGVRRVGPTIAELVDARLLDPGEGGWRVHDFLDWNPSASEVRARREAERARKARQRARGAEAVDHGDDGRFTSRRDTEGEGARASTATRPAPDPTGEAPPTRGLASVGRRPVAEEALVERVRSVCVARRRDLVDREAVAFVAWALRHVDARVVDEAVGSTPNPTFPRAVARAVQAIAARAGIAVPDFVPPRGDRQRRR